MNGNFLQKKLISCLQELIRRHPKKLAILASLHIDLGLLEVILL